MTSTRRWAAVALALALAVALTGCTRTRQAREWWDRQIGKRPAAGEAEAPAAPGGGKPYLASLIALHTAVQGDVVAVGAVNLSTIIANEPARFFVVNKWGMLPPGRHTEVVHILDPDRRERLASDQTEFEVVDFYRNTVIASEFKHVFTRTGNYWVQVHLDGKLMSEYPFRVREEP